MIAEKKVGLGTLGKGTTSYVTRSEHTSSLKGNCGVCDAGSGAFERWNCFTLTRLALHKVRTIQHQDRDAGLHEPLLFLSLGN